ncbi:hypothetical protein M404DRAFT_13470 [Pisolithus tinctorius Marx 270]|uniref:SET domain-containing protein n=1 Tax=Pisolithus tinctorius Marx 270 TaxID=870435 RepID=A0A0C3KPC7_PISTI|nr:hypothetical protein M404DRAFT_13470 [Pisolithus tinctorius Marx 270]
MLTGPNFESDYVELRTTQYGGRSLFAARDIPAGTRVHSSPGPFAHVIYKDYRREVCAQCFAYAASDSVPVKAVQSRVWSIKCNPEGLQASAAWFCSEDCKKTWEKDETGPLQLQLDAALTKALVASRRKGSKSTNTPSFGSADDLTQDAIDQAWKNSWTHFLHVQNNELANVREGQHILSAHLRIYAFLCNALPRYLLQYTPTTVREVLARDTGNAFGIWDGDRRDEMLGWGIWISASYFNHSCSPNIRKVRQGRTLHFETGRAVSAGEELCISYVDTDQPVEQRQKDLESSWFFRCGCSRCNTESRA